MDLLINITEQHALNAQGVHFYYLRDGEHPTSKTYTEIVLDAKKLAAYLIARFEPQSRIMLIYPPGLDFISSFLGCLYAGMIAVPAYPLQNPRHAYRLHSIIDSCEPKLILGNQTVLDNLSKIESLANVEKFATELLFASSEVSDFKINPKINESTIAFLQYTSGSTDKPKGVMVTHANLISNLSSLKSGWGLAENKTSVLWLPFQHDLGLIGGVLSSLYNKNNLVLLPPVSVIEKPYRWLKALTDFKAYFTAGPNFAYQLCVNKISEDELSTLDLSSVGYSLAAAEPNRYETMEHFCSKFAVCGFKKEAYSVGYGLAENTLHVTTNTPGNVSKWLSLSQENLAKGRVALTSDESDRYLILSAGTLHPEHEVAIVNPENKVRCAADEVGEIWIHGRSTAAGYWGNPEASKETFNMCIEGEETPYLRTGDLGFIDKNELYITGRQKDLIIIDGRNIYPQDLEAVVDACHEFIKPGCTAVFSVDTGAQEAIVVCAEIKRTAIKKDLSMLTHVIRHAIAARYEVAVHDIKLLKPNRSFKTTSGKIQRKATKKAWLENTLECVSSEVAVTPYQDQVSLLATDLHQMMAEILGLKKIGQHQRFSELGGTSMHATMLYQKLQDYLGPHIVVSQTVAFDYPTLAELIDFVLQEQNQPASLIQEPPSTNTNDKIAIIGIGCHLPGRIHNMEDLWTLLREGIDAIEPIPSWRWDISHYDDELKNRISQAGILEKIDQFDANFFNISPKEARQMDPQHRLLLAVAWEALENAAIPAQSLSKEKVGVYIGSSSTDYRSLIAEHDNDANIDPYFVLDNASSVMAGRIAYYLGTQGPAETIDTACSSSLVALNEACEAMQAGKIKMGLVGAVNVILYPENSVGLARANMLSPTSRCHTFSQNADGYVRSEGCAVVVLKRLADAVKDGDIIHAVIQSTAVNQDGASSGLTVPNLKAQEILLHDALKQANLVPNDIDYIEAHGSATVLGDPIEFGAINAVFGHQNRARPLYVGSIKSSLGHLEAASGMAGLLKTIAEFQHRELSANIHLDAINNKLNLDATPIEVVQVNRKWHAFGKPRRAGVSSFGFSGTNAHVILEEAPSPLEREELILPKEQVFVLSAKTQKSLDETIASYIAYLEHSNERIEDICYTAAVGRNHFSHRLALFVKDTADLLNQLKAGDVPSVEASLLDEVVSSSDVNVLAKDYLFGKIINWNEYYQPWLKALRKVCLPTYCFDTQRYWIDTQIKEWGTSISRECSAHPFLGSQFDSPKLETQIFESILNTKQTPLLLDHVFYGTPVFAYASYLSTIIEAARFSRPDASISLMDVMVEAPLLFKEHETRLVQTILNNEGDEDEFSVSIQSRSKQDVANWTTHATGNARYVEEEKTPVFIDINALKKQAQKTLSGKEMYEQAKTKGIDLGEGFQWVDTCFIGESNGQLYALAQLKHPDASYMGTAHRQSGYLDAGFVLGAGKCLNRGFETVCVPINMHRYFITHESWGSWVYVVLLGEDEETHRCQIQWCTDEGKVLDWIDELQFRVAPQARLLQSLHHDLPIDEELFVTAWKPHEVNNSDELPENILWFSALEEQVSGLSQGIPFHHIQLGTSWQVLNPKHIQLDKHRVDDYLHVLHDLVHQNTLLVYDGLALEGMEPSLQSSAPLLYLLQAMVQLEHVPVLVVLTHNAYSLNNQPNAPAASAINGLLITAAAEYPYLKLRQIDMDTQTVVESHLVSVFAKDNETVHVWRDGRCYVPRLRSLNQIQSTPSVFEIKTHAVTISSEGSYLITGGLGGLGLLTTEYLLNKQVKSVHLTARHEPTPETQERLNVLAEMHQAIIQTHAVDVGNQLALNDLINTLPNLSGIFHLAGVLDDASLPQQTMTRIESVAQGKAMGAYYLHDATKQQQIPIVFFSSIAALIGSEGQANYAMANAYLDALSSYRMSQGLASVSIAWGPWESVGMASSLQARMQKYGLGLLDKEGAFDLLDLALSQGYAHLGAASIRWSQLAKARLKAIPFLSELMVDALAEHGPLFKRLSKAPEVDRLGLLKQAITAMLRETLGLKPDVAVNPDEGFFNLGMDSLMAVTLRNKLQMALGSKHPITVAELFNYPAINKLSDFLAKKTGLSGLKAESAAKTVVRNIVGVDEPIAIIGMGCRYPGGANSPQQFWELLKKGYDGISDIPADRWNVEEYYSPDPDAPGKLIPRRGGFLKWPVGDFDANFFHVSPRQAEMTDPIHRLLLQVSWEALEDAGIMPQQLNNTETGVYVGIWHSDYADLIAKNHSLEGINSFTNATTLSAASGILSFFYGLKGPTYSVDTACSSSLVALDGAVKGLQRGECDMAMVAGANLILAPDISIGFDKSGMLSPDSSCKTFDESANGYVRSEGIGVIVIKRLSDALQDNDRIYGVIKGIRVNHNGPASGITVPNGVAQQELVEHVLATAKINPEDVDYLECHGTGTPLGDPIEVSALSEVFAKSHSASKPLLIGSVKSNIGHLEAAAGVAGLMKVLLAMQHDAIPPNIHFHHLNSKMNLDAMPAKVVTELTEWSTNDKLKVAGVSSFGATGINAHVILEEAPSPLEREELILPKEQVFVLSAKTQKSLDETIASYIAYLEHSNERIEDICYTAAVGRNHFSHRLALLVKDTADLLNQLKAGDVPSVEASLLDEVVSSSDVNVLAKDYLSGKIINWNEYYQPWLKALRKVCLPTYCFDTQRYWIDLKKSSFFPYGEPVHALLGAKLPNHSNEVRFLNQFALSELDYLKDHCLFGHIIFPGAGFVESALACGVEFLGDNPLVLMDFSLLSPLDLGGTTDYEVTLALADSDLYRGTIYARHGQSTDWVHQADFSLQELTDAHPEASDLVELKDSMDRMDVSTLYEHFKTLGLNYGEAFQSIKEVFTGKDKVLVAIKNEVISRKGYYFHPALLDGVFQAAALVVNVEQTTTYIPASIGRMDWYERAQGFIWAEVSLVKQDAHSITVNIKITDDMGITIAQIQGFVARVITQQGLERLLANKEELDRYVEDYEVYPLPVVNNVNDDELKSKHVVFMYEGNFSELVAFSKRLLTDKDKPLSFTLVTCHAFSINAKDEINPDQTQALGFWKTLRQETGSIACYLIDIMDSQQDFSAVLGLIREQLLTEPQIILREQVYVPRLLHIEAYAKKHYQLLAPESENYLTSEVGVDTLHWGLRELKTLAVDDIKIRIIATALNFRDVLKAMNLYPGDSGDFGYECVGEVLESGDTVQGIKPGDKVIVMGQGLLGGEAVVKSVQVVLLPKALSPAQGASIPIVFLTANYGLNQLAKIKKGQKVLIHAASGGVGLAAIELAKLKGAEVYATASRPKQAYLKETLGLLHVYDSRSTQFSEQILADTGGQGVDIVLNSLTGEGFISASLACLKKGGVFLEISKLNVYTQAQMDSVRPDVLYHLIEIDRRMEEEPQQIQKELSAILTLFAQEKLRPLPITQYPITEVIEAFHYLQQSKQIGKIVLINPEPFEYLSDATYLITGGTGGLGLDLARHLIAKGVAHLALISRSKASNELIEWMDEQQIQGVTITHYQSDVADKKGLKDVFSALARSKYPLKGIFHAAGLIQDGLLSNLSEDEFTAVLAPKIKGSLNLHKLSEKLNLDCFVLFSSVASLLGSIGQSNYAAANAFMDGLAIKRRKFGLPALSVNWGPFAKVGMASGLETLHRSQGINPLDTKHAFATMDALLLASKAQVGVISINWSKFLTQGNPYFSNLVTQKTQDRGEWQLLLDVTPKERREQVLTDKIKQVLAEILNINTPNAIDANKGFFESGMDSLMAVEFKNKLQTKLGNAMALTNTVAFDYNNVKTLQEYLLQGLAFKEKVHTVIQNKDTHDEEIAIIGLSGEFPGANNLEAFWQMLVEGKEGISEVPSTRWDIDDYYDPDPDALGKMISRRSGFIKDIEQFDAAFFAISPKEANYLDPQQRLLLKHSWLALESAGISPQSLKDSDTGVFIGISSSDYRTLITKYGDLNDINAFIGTGNASSTASGRISYFLGLQGPNLAIDTACSSSLVALNEACERLQRGECKSAIVGGVNALLSPELSINFSKAGMLAPDGKCKTFDERADGYVRGEGCGVVLLKRLSDALQDKDTIWAVIKASGINQDGASSGLTVPNGQAQERLLRQVLAQSHLSAADIDYVECHGTGTRLGDPIEVHALGMVYGQNRAAPLMLGSVKTNIGHLEAAAGIAGLIKVVLSLKYNTLPEHLNFHQLNSNITLNFPAEIVTQTTSWQSTNKPRRAALSSFGFSGTNAHVLLEEAPGPLEREEISLPKEQLFVLSAKTQKSLDKAIVSYLSYLEHSDERIEDICYTAAVGRNHFSHRLALFVKDKVDLLTQLKASDVPCLKVSLVDEVVTSSDVHVLVKDYLSGKNINWNEYYKPWFKALRKVCLPIYCFDTQRYWLNFVEKKQKTDWNTLPQWSYGQTWQSIPLNKSSTEKPLEPTFIDKLSALNEASRKKEFFEMVRSTVGLVLGVMNNSALDTTLGFFELGMNSMMAVELQKRLQQQIGSSVELKTSLAFDYPSIDAISDYLYEQLFGERVVLPDDEGIIDSQEPIAVIGMSCRYPGHSNSPDLLWDLLVNAQDGITEVPKSRWDMDQYYDPDPEKPGKSYTRYAGFIDDIEQFDPAFFNISRREAQVMDPQQRLLLEVSYAALEDAGYSLAQIKGSQGGVFVGASCDEYGMLLIGASALEDLDAYYATGNSLSIIAGRLSYTYGLEGPSEIVDTACSSSLVALHHAMQSLRNHECSFAIVGGVNAMIIPETFIMLSKAKMLAPDGKCKTFDEKADGYVRSEGCGVLILKRLSEAVRDNNKILAVIKGSAVNQDGASSGLTVPRGPSQEAVIRKALHNAMIKAEQVDYVEAHGTGTSLGDPIEVNTLAKVYGAAHATHPFLLGSVKTNLGHLEAASGIAGVIKVILSLLHEAIPAHLQFNQLNPNIDLVAAHAELPLTLMPWKSVESRARCAAVSSFGFSGTNAHVIVEEAPRSIARDQSVVLPQEQVFVLSAKNDKSLDALIHAYIDYLETSDESLADICYTVAMGRGQFAHRIAVVAQDKTDLLNQLKSDTLHRVKTTPSNEPVKTESLAVILSGYLAGKYIDWVTYYKPYFKALRKVNLPSYRFDTQRYWVDIKSHAVTRTSQPAEQDISTKNEIHLEGSLPESEQLVALQEQIKKQVSMVMKLPIENIPNDMRFFDLGMDSLMAVELRNRLQAQIGDLASLNVTLIFDYPDVLSLSEYLADKIFVKKTGTEEQKSREKVNVHNLAEQKYIAELGPNGYFVKQGPVGVLIINGVTGTPGEMKEFSTALTKNNFTIAIPQLAGHGSSLQDLKNSTWNDWYQSVEKAMGLLEKHCDTIFVAGLSAGALLAINLAVKMPSKIAGVILMSPVIFFDGWNMSRYKRFILSSIINTPLKFICDFKADSPFGIKNEARRSAIESLVKAPIKNNSSEVGRMVMPGVVCYEVDQLIKHTKQILPQFNTPTLIIHSIFDDMASIKNAEYIKNHMGTNHVEIKYLDDCYHLVTVDNQKELVSNYAAEFIKGCDKK